MKVLVLFSGGLKSTFLAALAKKEGAAELLFIDRGQRNLTSELEASQRVAVSLQLPFTKLSYRYCPHHEEPLFSLLCFFCHAFKVARKKKCSIIYHGLSRDDTCLLMAMKEADEFLKSLQHLIELTEPLYDGKGFWLGPVGLETPVRRLNLEHILKLGTEYKTPWHLTYSCDLGNRYHCGKCAHCERRRSAFVKAKIEDMTHYES